MPNPPLSVDLSTQADIAIKHCSAMLEGKATLADLIGYTPEMLESIYERAYNAWNAGDFESAAADFSFLVLQQPYDRRFHFALACSLKHYGEYQRALSFFGYATVMQADEPFAYFHIAECLHALDEIDAARDALDACILLCYGQANIDSSYDDLRQRATSLLADFNLCNRR